jgi:hypothetical protein
MKPHPHAEFIKAWADGAVVEYRTSKPEWKPVFEGWSWDNKLVVGYRIKPKPDFQQTMDVYFNKMYKHFPDDLRKKHLMIGEFSLLGTMQLTFDGETGKLKSAEVIA